MSIWGLKKVAQKMTNAHCQYCSFIHVRIQESCKRYYLKGGQFSSAKFGFKRGSIIANLVQKFTT
jgi:hypothetical protein